MTTLPESTTSHNSEKITATGNTWYRMATLAVLGSSTQCTQWAAALDGGFMQQHAPQVVRILQHLVIRLAQLAQIKKWDQQTVTPESLAAFSKSERTLRRLCEV